MDNMRPDVCLRVFVIFCVFYSAYAEDHDIKEKLKQIEEQLEGMEELKHEIGFLKDKNKQLEEEVEELKRWKIETVKLNRMSRLLVPNPTEVAFHANINGHISLTHNQSIKFDTTTLNLEQAYNTQTGVFTAPTPGYYVLFVHFLTENSKTLEAQLTKNGAVIQNVYVGDTTSYHDPGSNMAIVRLDQGDRVWVKVHDTYHSDGTLLDGPWCTFAGFLLYAEV